MTKTITKINHRVITLASCCVALLGHAHAGEFGDKHVLVIGIDGCRPDSLQFANTPNLDSLIAAGSVTYNAYAGGELNSVTQQPTMSGPGWSSILTGVWANKHGVTGNGFSGRDFTAYPHFYSRIRETNPNASLSSIIVWSPIDDIIVADSANSADYRVNSADDVALTNSAVTHLGNSDPDVLFLHFDEVDHAGHAYGYSNSVSQYVNSIEGVDTQIGTILTAIQNRPNYANEDWLYLVTTDHGGIGFGHGGQSVDERKIFMIASGGAAPVQVLTDGPGHNAVPATVLKHLGLSVNPSWGWDDFNGFAIPPFCPDKLAGSIDVANSQVHLTWNPASQLDITGYELKRDGVVVANLPVGDSSYTDTVTIPAQPGEVSYIYTLTATGGTQSSLCPVLSVNLSAYTGNIADDLVGYYAFDGDLSDASGSVNTNNGSVGGGSPSYISGLFGNAVSLDGVDDYVTLGNPADYNFGTSTDFTISFWYKTGADQASDPVIIGNKNWASGSNAGWLIEAAADNGDDFALQCGDGTNRADGATYDLAFNTWYHVTAVFKRGQTMELYVNGVLTSSTSIANVTGSFDALMTNIGQDGTGVYSDFTLMDMDDLAIWRRALYPSEAQLLYSEGQAGQPLSSMLGAPVDLAQDRVLFLPLDSDASDLSSESNNGTINGSPSFTTGTDGNAISLLDTANPHQYVNLGNPTSLQFGTGTDFSVAVWVKNSGGFQDNRASGGSADDPAILSNKDWNSGVNKGWILAAGANGRWQWNIGDGSSRRDYDSAGGLINDGNWHLLVATHDRDGLARLYYDGQEVATRDISTIGDIDAGLVTAVGTDGTLGSNWANWFTGGIDNAMIWRRVITPEEIVLLYAGETGGADPVSIFSDDFESGSFAAGGWSTQNANASVDGAAAQNGAEGASLERGTWIEKTISTVGYSDIKLEYGRRTEKLDSGEYLTVEYNAGSGWVTVEQTQETVWGSVSADLSAAAANNSALAIRFRTNASSKKEYGFVDEVNLIGTPN
ncbi:Predicted pyrophosphatase or phosphodiesterase, AlkP superfamily [Rubritalea squalenifaciens DSM 18772]|uniref:Predicted pyrophosphatase or phosphodiesterase, AlkP superfamily n=1 Tax=Rubritalea squalenifaciens DSM 18772 TaxID=1123071 RepID=A0A1M6D7S1_9BACT|nr:LamG-like jellyroll fold domain-containing protein [Rubritalea squalenifaciens]SHI69038.1 Predicted pyrophosphatase or phosphodiesterase, AlkP superfamily [Rubritalea squalenifaciens DSM 18772]